ncbi:DNA-processing protein DprA [Streptomyces sp. NPDC005885]
MGDDLRVAVVGTRTPHSRGHRPQPRDRGRAGRAGRHSGQRPRCRIGTAAHGATLAVACRTVAVIGTGLRRSYPVQKARLQQEIAERGLLLSQFRPDASPSKASFPMRNAVMSGYSLAAVVVEAAYRSGARVQARFALEQVDGFSSCVSAAVREGWLPTFSSSTSAWGSQPF